MPTPDAQTPGDAIPESQPGDPGEQNDAVRPAGEQAGEIQFKPVDLPDFPALKSYLHQAAPANAAMVEIKELSEELAEDMLRMMEWTKRLEAGQEQLSGQVEALQQVLQENKRQATLEISQLRQELLGERKALAVRGAFNAILPTLDSLRAMLSALADTPKNNSFRTQINTVIGSLTNITQSLGYIEFQVAIGAPFDPFQMECLDYGKGEPNTVLEVIRSGYKTENMIIRPCGVVIAQK